MVDTALLDLIEAFGPLSGMHAALDRIGCGMPCGLVARFEGRSVEEVEKALAAASERFAILRSELVWSGERPYLRLNARSSRDAGADGASLRLMAAGGALWTKRLVGAGDDTWLICIFAHAAVDGLSMLRFLQALEAHCYGVQATVRKAPSLAAAKRPPTAPWMGGFLLDRMRSYAQLDQAGGGELGVSLLQVPANVADDLIHRSRSAYGGFAPHFAAAAALSVSEQRNEGRRPVLLNLPIARSDLAQFDGFGFDVGSLITPVSMCPQTDIGRLSHQLSIRLRSMREKGWDKGLDRLIGRDVRRHAFFAATWARSKPDPSINISWKGTVQLGGGGLRDVACFAAAPTAHISAHQDLNGLSISLTSTQPLSIRAALLERIARHLGAPAPITSLDVLSDGPRGSS